MITMFIQVDFNSDCTTACAQTGRRSSVKTEAAFVSASFAKLIAGDKGRIGKRSDAGNSAASEP